MNAAGRKSAGGGRRAAYRAVAAVMAVFAVGFGLWTAIFGVVGEDQEVHAFHNVIVASLLIVLSAPAAAWAARDPESSTPPLLHLSALGAAALSTMAIALTIDYFTLPFVVLTGVLWILRPRPPRPVPRGGPSPVLLVLVAAGVVPLVAYAISEAGLQRTIPESVHAELFHWVEAAFYSVAVLLLGLLAALRPAAFRVTAWCAGLALVFLVGAETERRRLSG